VITVYTQSPAKGSFENQKIIDKNTSSFFEQNSQNMTLFRSLKKPSKNEKRLYFKGNALLILIVNLHNREAAVL
jgi:hypothetical protein